jgi:hypothetical protein
MFDLSQADLVTSYARASGLQLGSPEHVRGLGAVAALVATKAVQREHRIRTETARQVRVAISTARKALQKTPSPAHGSQVEDNPGPGAARLQERGGYEQQPERAGSCQRRNATARTGGRPAARTVSRGLGTIGESVLRAASATRGLTVAELAQAAGVTRAQAQSACQRLLRAGKLGRSGRAGEFRYRVAT